MDIFRALEIPGWMTPQELFWLAEQAQTHSRIVEIGSYLGRSTRTLGDHTPGFVLAIDDWKGPRDIECDAKDLMKKFYRNMKDLIEAGKVRYLRVDHRAVPPLEFQPDMVFLDGSHEYEDVLNDILVWQARLVSEGLLCGHDFNAKPGVNRAVTELLPGARRIPNTDIWAI